MRSYYLDQLYPEQFQKLVNALLISFFGENLRITPVTGADGGRDNETAPLHPIYGYVSKNQDAADTTMPMWPRPGRYLFQVKHHSSDGGNAARKAVIRDFREELKKNVLTRKDSERVNHFFLITNVSSSKAAFDQLDSIRNQFGDEIEAMRLSADVWWYDHIAALLDGSPNIWARYPTIFPGGKVPTAGLLGATEHETEPIPNALRLTLQHDLTTDARLRFNQIELHSELAALYVDVEIQPVREGGAPATQPQMQQFVHPVDAVALKPQAIVRHNQRIHRWNTTARYPGIRFLVHEVRDRTPARILLQGGPGQGKSTISQMLAQVHRMAVLGVEREGSTRQYKPTQPRIPFRIELRTYADWHAETRGSLEQYLAEHIRRNSGGVDLGVHALHDIFYSSPTLLIFDGLDEIGSGDARDRVLAEIDRALTRLDVGESSDVRVLITTRPPAITHHVDRLSAYAKYRVMPMDNDTINDYLERWLDVQNFEPDETANIRVAFLNRCGEAHVEALSTNPMQLAILLHFIRLKGEAFPSRRAELYQQYFQIVIDRDVVKNRQLAEKRSMIEGLHEVVGFQIHALTETGEIDGSLPYTELKDRLKEWLLSQEENPSEADQLIRVGEERLCLIVAMKGEGENTSYGFAVQPIREYFAAAYLRNQSGSNPHNSFELLLRRTFWNEVALFLAGLSLPNEKADIIQRCVDLDEDEMVGWKQLGRSAILRLVEEGVLDTPAATYNQAMIHLIDGYSPFRDARVSIDRDFFSRVRILLQKRLTPRVHKRVKEVVSQADSTSDLSEKIRLSWLKSGVLSCDETSRLPPSPTSLPPVIAAITKVLHSLEAGCDPISGMRDFDINSIRPHIWAKAIMESTKYNDNAESIEVPQQLHQALFDELALLPDLLGLRLRDDERISVLEVHRMSAVWALKDLLNSLIIAGVTPGFTSLVNVNNGRNIGFDIRIHRDVQWTGLSDELCEYGPVLVEHGQAALQCVVEGDSPSSIYGHMRAVLHAGTELMGVPGATGYFAAKFGRSILAAAAQYHVYEQDGASPGVRRALATLFRRDGAYLSFGRQVAQYYVEDGTRMNRAGVDRVASVLLSDEFYRQPESIRVSKRNRPITIASALRRIYMGQSRVVKLMDISHTVLNDERIRDVLWGNVRRNDGVPDINVLSAVGVAHVELYGWRQRGNAEGAETSATKADGIVEIMNGSGDAAVQSGCFIALAALGMAHRCPPELMVEALWARWGQVFDFGQDLFQSEMALICANPEERNQYLRDVARHVLSTQHEWPGVLLEIACEITEAEISSKETPFLECAECPKIA